MERNFNKIAKEFLTELAMTKGQKKPYGMNKGNFVYVFKSECPLLNDNGEEEKVIINTINLIYLAGRQEQSVSITTHDCYAKHIKNCTDDYLRLVIRSLCVAHNLNEMWLMKLAGH